VYSEVAASVHFQGLGFWIVLTTSDSYEDGRHHEPTELGVTDIRHEQVCFHLALSAGLTVHLGSALSVAEVEVQDLVLTVAPSKVFGEALALARVVPPLL